MYRLLIVSSRSRSKLAISAALQKNVFKLEYDYETFTLTDLVRYFAFLQHQKVIIKDNLKIVVR